MNAELNSAAVRYLSAGISVIPTIREGDSKRVALSSWKQYQTQRATSADVFSWAGNSIGLVCGAVSGNLELLDFDDAGSAFDEWAAKVRSRAAGLLESLTIERSPSGGRHVIYRSAEEITGNAKLATKRIWCESSDEIERGAKRFKPRRIGDRWYIDIVLIETRGEGGMFICAPSPGYEIEAGSLSDIATITAQQRAILLQAAAELSQEYLEAQLARANPMIGKINTSNTLEMARSTVGEHEPGAIGNERPGDAYNERGDFRALLERHGWRMVIDGENQHWRRPGKKDGMSATLKGRCFYVFSTNAPPFEGSQAYSPFGVFAMLECGGDFAAASMKLREMGFGDEFSDIDLSGFATETKKTKTETDLQKKSVRPVFDRPIDPGEMPKHLLSVPGFVGEVMRYDLKIAFRPQPILALAGALALQAILAGRKVKDSQGNRTAVQIVGIAASGAGKDNSRKVCKRILHQSGASAIVGPEDLASDAGMYSVLTKQPASLFLLDEFGRFLRTAGDPKRAPHLYAVITLMMKLYSSAGEVYLGKAYADGDRNKEINQPCAVVYGSSVPEHFYDSLTVESVSDGYMSRLLVFEAADRGIRNDDASDEDPPQSIIERAKNWMNWNPSAGNLGDVNPRPIQAKTTAQAEKLFRELADFADSKPPDAENAIWTRAVQKARQMALLFACSAAEPVQNGAILEFRPVITNCAAQWSIELVQHLTERMIFLADAWVSSSEFDKKQRAVVRAIRASRGAITHTKLIRHFHRWSAREREEVMGNLLATKQIICDIEDTNGRPTKIYKLVQSADLA